MADKRNQKGAQRHAEGMRGPKAHKHFQEELRSGESGVPADDAAKHDTKGKNRLFQRREQRDEADLASEKNRLNRDIREHGHNRENFQVRGGSASGRATPRNPINPGEPDKSTPGEPQPPAPRRVPGVGGS